MTTDLPDEATLRETAVLIREILNLVQGRRSPVALSSLLGALTLAAHATGCAREDFLTAVHDAYDSAPTPDDLPKDRH